MQKSFLLILVILISQLAFTQSYILRSMKKKAKDMGFTYEKKELIGLEEGQHGYCFFTAKPGRKYKIFGFPEYSQVSDTDLWVYDEDNNAKLIGKDTDNHAVGIVDFTVTKETRVSVKIANMKTEDDNWYGCFIMVTSRKL